MVKQIIQSSLLLLIFVPPDTAAATSLAGAPAPMQMNRNALPEDPAIHQGPLLARKKFRRRRARHSSSRGLSTGRSLGGFAGNAGWLNTGITYGGGIWYAGLRPLHQGIQVLYADNTLDTGQDPKDLAEEMEIRSLLIKANVRWFFWNSFFVAGGLGHLNISGTYGFRGLTEGVESSLLNFESSNNILADAFIGNQWEFLSGHVIGIDWLGITRLLSYSVEPSTDDAAAIAKVKERMVFFNGNDDVQGRLEEILEHNYNTHSGIDFIFQIRFGMHF